MTKTKKVHKKLELLIPDTERLKFLLEECDYGRALQFVSKKQWNELVNSYESWLKENFAKQETVDADIWNETLKFLTLVVEEPTSHEKSHELLKLVLLFIDRSEKGTDDKLQNNLCKFCELWLAKDLPAEIQIVLYIMNQVFLLINHADNVQAKDVKRLANIEDYLIDYPNITGTVNKLIDNYKFVSFDGGQKFLAKFAAKSFPLFRRFCQAIATHTQDCSKLTSIHYGRLLMISWKKADENIRPQMVQWFQYFIESFIVFPRRDLSLSKLSTNVLALINVWNEEARQKDNAEFVTMIMNCYKPILWKYLKGGLNYQRCNAADLFLKAFPLQLPKDDEANVDIFLEQINCMADVLRDENCHIVRIIGVREVCNILSVYWTMFSKEQIHKLVTIITQELLNDSSSFEVRRMAFRGLESFVATDNAFAYLKVILPSLKNYLYDVSAAVRIAFIRLLLAVQARKDPKFQFTDVVSVSELTYSLLEENTIVGQWIVRLLLPKYYKPNLSEREWIFRFSLLIKKYPQCYRNFFCFSGKALPFADALKIMCGLIESLGSYIMSKLRVENEENNTFSDNMSKKTSSSPRKNASTSSANSTVSGQSCAYDDPVIVTGILEIVNILWVVHASRLTKKPSAASLLLDTYLGHALNFINYFKGTCVFNSVVVLTGNVPVNLLTQNSITLPGYCLKKLKTGKTDNFGDNEIIAMIGAIVKWGRAGDLLEIIGFWLESAFNADEIEMVKKRTKRVKISDTIEPDSLLAIRLLDSLLKDAYTRIPVVKKHYDVLVEIFNGMENIKNLINRRLARGIPNSDELLSDEFLIACFQRYIKFIPLLHNNGENLTEEEKKIIFNGRNKLDEVFVWMQEYLIPLLHRDKPTDLQLVVLLINEILGVTESMILVNYIPHDGFEKLSQATAFLFTISHNLQFIKALSRVTCAMCSSACLQLHLHSMNDVWFTIVPNLFSNILNALGIRRLTREELAPFKKQLVSVKTSITKILAAYQARFNSKINSQEVVKVMELLVKKMLLSARAIVSSNIISENNTIAIFNKISDLPTIAGIILEPLFNSKFYAPFLVGILAQNSDYNLKALIVDIRILYLFVKDEKYMWNSVTQELLDTVWNQLLKFKYQRKSDHSFGVTLVDGAPELENDDSSSEDEDDDDDPDPANLLPCENDSASNQGTDGIEQAQDQEVESNGEKMMDITELEANPALSSAPAEVEGCTEMIPLSQNAVAGSQGEVNDRRALEMDVELSVVDKLNESQVEDFDPYDNDYINCGELLLKHLRDIYSQRAAAGTK